MKGNSDFFRRSMRYERSATDVNGIDPQIHNGAVRSLMSGLRDILRQPGDVITVPEMLARYRAAQSSRRVPSLRRTQDQSCQVPVRHYASRHGDTACHRAD
jgi:hypothetical protein